MPKETFALDLRYSDFDSYRHVSSSRYLDFLTTALATRAPQLTHIQTYIQKVEISYRRPIGNLGRILVELDEVPKVVGENPLPVDYKIQGERSAGPSKYAQGSLWLAKRENPTPLDRIVPSPADPAYGTPILFERTMDIRHNDPDIHNELDLAQYLELVTSSRWHFLKQKFGLTAKWWEEQGVGFFVTKAELQFGPPVVSTVRVRVRSWANEMRREGTEVLVPFEIADETGETIHCTGQLTFAIMTFEDGRFKRGAMPLSTRQYFFEKHYSLTES